MMTSVAASGVRAYPASASALTAARENSTASAAGLSDGQRLAFAAGLPPIRVHDLRHGAVSLAKKAGADIKAIQEMLRHSSHAITADTYTSFFEDDDRAVAEAMSTVVPRGAVVREASETDGPVRFPQANRRFPPCNVIKEHPGQTMGRPGLEPGTYGLKRMVIRFAGLPACADERWSRVAFPPMSTFRRLAIGGSIGRRAARAGGGRTRSFGSATDGY